MESIKCLVLLGCLTRYSAMNLVAVYPKPNVETIATYVKVARIVPYSPKIVLPKNFATKIPDKKDKPLPNVPPISAQSESRNKLLFRSVLKIFVKTMLILKKTQSW